MGLIYALLDVVLHELKVIYKKKQDANLIGIYITISKVILLIEKLQAHERYNKEKYKNN